MPSWRDIRRKARRDLHRAMRVPALYYPAGPSGAAIPVRVRVWQGHRYLGDMKGTAFDFAELADNTPSVVTLDAEIVPQRGAVFSVEPGEAYRVDRREPKDDITSISHVVTLPSAQAQAYTYPKAYSPTRLSLYGTDLARAFGFSFSVSASLAGFPVTHPSPAQIVLDYTDAEVSGEGESAFSGTRLTLLAGKDYLIDVHVTVGDVAPGAVLALWSNAAPPGSPAWSQVLSVAAPEYMTAPVRFAFLVTGTADTEANGLELRVDVPASTVQAVAVSAYHAGEGS